MFDLLIWDIQITLDEIFYDMVSEARDVRTDNKLSRITSIAREYERFRAYQRIYERMDELKYDTIDWDRGIKDGIFSLTNYYQIPQLMKFREQGNKQFLDRYPKEEYDRGLKTIKDLEEEYKD
jgi:hypothetical protein